MRTTRGRSFPFHGWNNNSRKGFGVSERYRKLSPVVLRKCSVQTANTCRPRATDVGFALPQEICYALSYWCSWRLLKTSSESGFTASRKSSPKTCSCVGNSPCIRNAATPKNLWALTLTMARENPSWGEGRIADGLSLKLGVFVMPAQSANI